MQRDEYFALINTQFKVHSVCALLGPRQVGKTTIAKMYLEKFPKEDVCFFDLENPNDLAKLENPMLALTSSSCSFIVIDEIQRRPDLFPVLRVLADQGEKKFLILGSASRDLIRQSSETLAGRIGYIELQPFSLQETNESEKLWLRGGFPRSYLATNSTESYLWRQSFISTFLERDIPSLGFQIPPEQIRRFWMMLAHYHGQIFNGSEIGRSLGISGHTVRKYLDILVGTFMVRVLEPWFENLKKRQVKSPKIYFRDSGILHALLGIESETQLQNYPKLAALWEGFALEEIVKQLHTNQENYFFWNSIAGAELDLLLMKGGRRIGLEFKYTDYPKITSSMRICLEDLRLDHLFLIYPGNQKFALSEKITAQGLRDFVLAKD